MSAAATTTAAASSSSAAAAALPPAAVIKFSRSALDAFRNTNTTVVEISSLTPVAPPKPRESASTGTSSSSSTTTKTQDIQQLSAEFQTAKAKFDKRASKGAKKQYVNPRETLTFARVLPLDGASYLRIDGRLITDPTLLNLYVHGSKQLNIRSPYIVPFILPKQAIEAFSNAGAKDAVCSEQLDSTLEMTMGFFELGVARTPILYALLQGPLANPRTNDEQNSSQWPALVTLAHLNQYYRAVRLVLMDSFLHGTRGDEQMSEETRQRVQQFAIQLEEKKSACYKSIDDQVRKSMFEAMKDLFADEQPKSYRITYERQLSRTTPEWVAQHRAKLEKLANSIWYWTVSRINVLEASIYELLGLQNSNDTFMAVKTPLDPVRFSELTEEPHLRSMKNAYVRAARSLCSFLLQFPSMKKDNSGPTAHHAEGEHLRVLIEKRRMLEDIVNPELRVDHKKTENYSLAPLAFIWMRVCSFARILDAQREYAEEYGKSPAPPTASAGTTTAPQQ